MDETVVRKIKPNSPDSEQALLSCLLMSRDAVVQVADTLSPDDFYQPQYREIYAAILDLYQEGKTIDMVTLRECLRAKNVPESVYSMEVMQDLVGAVSTSVGAKDYADLIRDRAGLRRVIAMTEQISNDCYALKCNSKEVIATLEDQVLKLAQSDQNIEDFTPARDIVNQVLRNVWEASKQKGNVTGVPTGFIDLDDKLTGLHGSELILIAARPGVGKTAFALNIAQYVLMHTDIPVAIFNFEMNKEQIMQRLIAMDSQVNSQNLRTGNLQDEEWQKLYESSNLLGESRLIVEDDSSVTIGDIREKCRRLKQKYGVGLIIIDYLQLMSGNKRTDSRQQEVSEISRGLKVLSKELDVPIIALSQLSRAVESRSDHRPVLSDLRESGAIEQDADVVMFIHRSNPSSEEEAEVDRNKAEIIIAKQRNGALGSVFLGWQGEYTKFVNLERSYKNTHS